MQKVIKTYDTDSQPMPMASESGAEYGGVSPRRNSRMTVEEYFSEVRKVLHKKYEDVQG